MAFPTQRPVTIKIATVDRTASIDITKLVIVDAINQQIDTATFEIEDGGGMSLAAGQEVLIHKVGDPATIYFGGVISQLESWKNGPTRDYLIQCDDFTWHMDNAEDVVSGYYVDDSDQTIIDAFMDGACSQIDDTTHVEEVLANTGYVKFIRKTPREAVQYLADLSGAFWYVDYDKKLHYFDAATNDAPFDLSDDPDLAATFGFKNMRVIEAAPLANRVIVIGKHLSETRTLGAEGDYGHWITRVLRDDNLLTQAQLQAAGDQYLAQQAEADTITCMVREPGLRSGMTIDVTDVVFGFSADSFEIREIRKKFITGGYIEHYLTIGKYAPSSGEILESSPNVTDTDQYVPKNAGEITQESSDDAVQGAQHKLISYNETDEYQSTVALIKSHTTAVGTPIQTVDGETLGIVRFKGHSDANAERHGAYIRVNQVATSGDFVPAVMDFVTYSTNAANSISMRIYSDGRIGIKKDTGADGQLHIDQNDASAAIPVLVLDQAHVTSPFVGCIGTAAAAALDRSIVDEGDQGGETLEGWLMVEVDDVGDQIADAKYFVPFYSVFAIVTGAASLVGASLLEAIPFGFVLAAAAMAGAGALAADSLVEVQAAGAMAGAGALAAAGLVEVQAGGAVAGAGALAAAGEVIVP